jgi:hypothetical protein
MTIPVNMSATPIKLTAPRSSFIAYRRRWIVNGHGDSVDEETYSDENERWGSSDCKGAAIAADVEIPN